MSASEQRDIALSSVEDHHREWIGRAFLYVSNSLRRINPTWEFTGEQLRRRIEDHKYLNLSTIPKPEAMGAFIMKLVRAQIIEDTGRWQAMEGDKSHSRRSPIWRFRA